MNGAGTRRNQEGAAVIFLQQPWREQSFRVAHGIGTKAGSIVEFIR
jgi:hypothetical protein